MKMRGVKKSPVTNTLPIDYDKYKAIVPEPADEAMRDLVRTREDAATMQRQARHRLALLVLRNDRRYAGKKVGTVAHRHWIASL